MSRDCAQTELSGTDLNYKNVSRHSSTFVTLIGKPRGQDVKGFAEEMDSIYHDKYFLFGGKRRKKDLIISMSRTWDRKENQSTRRELNLRSSADLSTALTTWWANLYFKSKLQR